MKLKPIKITAVGTTRNVLRFAFFPATLSDGTRIWLEWYTIRYEYVSVYGGMDGNRKKWVPKLLYQ